MIAHSEELGGLAAALAKAQAGFPAIDLDGTGQVGQNRNYKYATLSHILTAVRPVLAANGLAVVQTCEPSAAGTLRVTTTLLHASGQHLSGTLELPLANNTPQGAGSAITYARRYSLSAILGLAAEDDDDGHEGSQGKPPRARTAPPVGPAQGYGQMNVGVAPEIARRWFFAKVKEECGIDAQVAKKLLGIESYSQDMPDKTFGEILRFIKMEQLRQQKAQNAAN